MESYIRALLGKRAAEKCEAAGLAVVDAAELADLRRRAQASFDLDRALLDKSHAEFIASNRARETQVAIADKAEVEARLAEAEREAYALGKDRCGWCGVPGVTHSASPLSDPVAGYAQCKALLRAAAHYVSQLRRWESNCKRTGQELNRALVDEAEWRLHEAALYAVAKGPTP